MKLFPAIAVGGPPHAGKSVLTYSLTQALRERRVDHYVLRACPDGEGDWSQETPPSTVNLIRRKGEFTDQFVERVCRDLAKRHLPLLVDVGGRPTEEQEAILDHCSHAILLSRDALPEGEYSPERWREIVKNHGAILIAELHSVLDRPSEIVAEHPILKGEISGLERQNQADCVTFNAVLDRVSQLFDYEQDELRQAHFSLAPTELVVDLDQLGRRLHPEQASIFWTPQDLTAVLDFIPGDEPIALYGRGPNWLYAALAIHARSAPFFQFDARLGWVSPVSLQTAVDAKATLIAWELLPQDGYTRLEISIPDSYLDHDEVVSQAALDLCLPALPMAEGLVISGQIPHWLLTSIGRAYQEQLPWIAAYQPNLKEQAVVVMSQDSQYPVGMLLAASAELSK